MANPELGESDATGEIRVDSLEVGLRDKTFALAKLLLDSGWMSEKSYDALQITSRRRYNGKISALRRPMMVRADAGCAPHFEVYDDVLRSHSREFREVFGAEPNFLDDSETDRLMLTYVAAVGLGEWVLRRHITDPSYARTPARLALLTTLLTDTTDFQDHFRSRLDDRHLAQLLSHIDDSAALQINGLRAGLTIIRSAVQDVYHTDFMTDETLLRCNFALEEFIRTQGPTYIDTAERYLRASADIGVGAFVYAVPEWLYVLAVPMKPDRLTQIFDERFVDTIGEADAAWSPIIQL